MFDDIIFYAVVGLSAGSVFTLMIMFIVASYRSTYTRGYTKGVEDITNALEQSFQRVDYNAAMMRNSKKINRSSIH